MAALVVPLLAGQVPVQDQREAGIPVTDSLVIAKCGSCHQRDERGNMERISWARSSPEGWQDAVKKMILQQRIALNPQEARAIVKYLSTKHGLAPEEARSLMYYPERRVVDETTIADQQLLNSCAKCHPAVRPLLWRRSADEWKQFADSHAKQYKVERTGAAVAFLDKMAPLHTTEWASWSARVAAPDLKGRWLVTAQVQGRGVYVGEMQVSLGADPEDFTTRVSLRSIRDGSTIVRTGQAVVFGGGAWRGRSKGESQAHSAPDDLSNEAREVLLVSRDEKRAEGRWFWGQYQEFGFDVKVQRPSPGITLLAVDRRSLKVGSKAASVRLIGDNIPERVTAADVNLGRGITVRRLVSRSPAEVIVEVDVSANAAVGVRDVALQASVLKDAVAIYDRVDYIKVTPESSLAGFGSQKYPRGYQQFEAVGYQRGPDGKMHTADDLELGPIEAAWSMEVFYETDSRLNDQVGKISQSGLFTPAPEDPGVNYDIWVIATALNETNKDSHPLVGKGYVVVTIPEYMFNGRHYIRDLDRWIEEGTW